MDAAQSLIAQLINVHAQAQAADLSAPGLHHQAGGAAPADADADPSTATAAAGDGSLASALQESMGFPAHHQPLLDMAAAAAAAAATLTGGDGPGSLLGLQPAGQLQPKKRGRPRKNAAAAGDEASALAAALQGSGPAGPRAATVKSEVYDDQELEDRFQAKLAGGCGSGVCVYVFAGGGGGDRGKLLGRQVELAARMGAGAGGGKEGRS